MITEEELTTLLGRATTDVEPGPVPVEDLIVSGRRGRRRRGLYAGSGVVAAAAVAGVLAVTTPWSSGPAATPLAGGGECRQQVPSRVLPTWARAGFSGKHPAMPYVVGREGRLAALLFAQPLTAPPPTDGRNNKILWVVHPLPGGPGAQHQGRDLVIHAHLVDGSASVVRTVAGGPGPSIVDLPTAGCWRLDLSWGTLTDTMDLYYAAG